MQDKNQKQDNGKEKAKDKNKLFSKYREDRKFGYHGTSKHAHLILWIAFIFLVIGFIWSYFATIDEVTVAQGKVIPSKQIQLIQNLEGGIVKEILVHRGQIVEKGQILAYLDNTRFESEYASTRQKEVSLLIRITRLTAEVEKKPLHMPLDLKKAQPELATTEISLFDNRKRQLQSLNERRNAITKEIAMTAPLVKEGVVSKVDLLHLDQEREKVDNEIFTFNNAALDELNKSKAELASLKEEINAMKDRLERTTVRSPVKGIVNQLYVNTVGGVIKPGDNLIDVVPLDDTLLVEGRVKPADIGFIHVGQDATVKISAYDYSIYGGLPAKVEHISPDTLKDEKKDESYFEVHVRTKQNYIQAPEKRLYIIPGMTATVDILTGHKSVLDYIMKPILKAKQSALRER